jgi:acyl carrier protein
VAWIPIDVMPELIICTIAAVGFAIYVRISMRRLRRCEEEEVERFNAAPRTADADFLRELGLEPGFPAAEIALFLRKMLAEAGDIPPDRLRPSMRFYPDLERLPYYDSPDLLELIFLLEEHFDAQIRDADADEILRPVIDGTVGEFILAVLRWRERQGTAV